MEFYHRPVLLDECLNGLAIREDGAYLDGTLGGGGHSSEILKRLTAGRLIGIDRDADALKAATSRIHALQTDGLPRFDALYGNFHDAKALLEGIGIEKIDGALLDLGVSSYQLDEGSRGFSYHADAPLDMRMDRRQALTAAVIVNEWPENEIARVIRDWGEENWAVQIARVICDRRKLKRIETTGTFQGLRIAVNDELAPLENALRDIASLLNPGGRLCVIAFHSLEDRVVKNTFKNLADPCVCPKSFPVCVCGRKPVVRLLTRKPITASEEELAENPRARSATLRIVEKLEEA